MRRHLELDCTGTNTCPGLAEDIWPLLKSHSSEVGEVLLFRTKRLAHERILRDLVEVHPSLFSLGTFGYLDSEKEGLARVLSHYGGHLNVLYRTDSVRLLHSLVDLWPMAAVREDEAFGLEGDELAAFAAAVAWTTRSGAAFAFFHDGFPMLVFGADDLIVGLQEHHSRASAGEPRPRVAPRQP